MTVVVGQAAPDFTLPGDDGKPVALADLRGENVLLLFFPWSFSPTCTVEFCTLRDDNPDIVTDAGALVFGVSTDPTWSLRAWRKAERFPNRFLSDFWPHGQMCRAYGSFNEETGAAKRNTVLLDREGIVRFVEMDLPRGPRDQQAWRAALSSV